MFRRRFQNRGAACFVCGALTATLGVRLIKSKAARTLMVKGLARGMSLKDETPEALQNVREQAEDIYRDAKNPEDTAE